MSRPASTVAPRPDLPRLGPVLEFLRLIWALDHALQRASKRMERTLGITGPQRLVMLIVARFPGIVAGQVAAILHLHPSTLTGILKRLERQGLLTRRRSSRDRRRAMLGLSPKGLRLEARAGGTVEAAVREVLAELEPIALDHAETALRLLACGLEDGEPERLSRRTGLTTGASRRGFRSRASGARGSSD